MLYHTYTLAVCTFGLNVATRAHYIEKDERFPEANRLAFLEEVARAYELRQEYKLTVQAYKGAPRSLRRSRKYSVHKEYQAMQEEKNNAFFSF